MTPIPQGAHVRILPDTGHGSGETGTVVRVHRQRVCRECGLPKGQHAPGCPPLITGRLRWRVSYEVLLDRDAAAGRSWRVGCEAGEVEAV